MNLIDAIKSGKQFRRKSQPNQDFWFRPMDTHSFTQDEIIAEDWEVEEEKIEITWTELSEKYNSAWNKFYCAYGWEISHDRFTPGLFEEYLKKELGL